MALELYLGVHLSVSIQTKRSSALHPSIAERYIVPESSKVPSCSQLLSCWVTSFLEEESLLSFHDALMFLFHFAATSSSLYFRLNGIVYLPESIVLITAIGDSETDPDSSLVCVTSKVNMQCCRGSDGGNVGEWHFPNETIVPRNSGARSADFTRSGFTHQVRLNHRNNAMSPNGTYECRVPDGDSGELVNGSIVLG